MIISNIYIYNIDVENEKICRGGGRFKIQDIYFSI